MRRKIQACKEVSLTSSIKAENAEEEKQKEKEKEKRKRKERKK